MRIQIALAVLGLFGLATPALAQNDPVGTRYLIRPADLPKPFATPSASNSGRVVPRPAGHQFSTLPGFTMTVFADGFSNARYLHVVANGDVLLAETRAGRISVLRDADGDGRAETVAVLAENLNQPHGLVARDGWLYVGEATQVRRLPYTPGDLKARGPAEDVTRPGSLGPSPGNHRTREILFAPDGQSFTVSVGSRGNLDEEPLPHASIQWFKADGTGQRPYATGLRNPIGMGYEPRTGALYTIVNERDGYGDEMVPDYLTRVADGDFYGWPYALTGAVPDPEYGSKRPDLVAKTKTPDVLFRAHSAPIGMVFYTGDQFPAEFKGDAFVTLQGSWNARQPTGYKIVRVPFRDGRPTGEYINFVTNLWVAGTSRAEIVARPAGITQARDGSLLVADDGSQTVWRIAYSGKK
jgi:glucose/arabinose dehydrogenase